MICLMVVVGLAIIGVIIVVLVRKYRRKPEKKKAVNDAEDPTSRPGICLNFFLFICVYAFEMHLLKDSLVNYHSPAGGKISSLVKSSPLK